MLRNDIRVNATGTVKFQINKITSARVLIYVSDIFRKPNKENAKAVFEVKTPFLNLNSQYKEHISLIRTHRKYKILCFLHCMHIEIAREVLLSDILINVT
jgi:hypothetical protein